MPPPAPGPYPAAVAEFLSPEWLRALDAAARDATWPPWDGAALVVEQRVHSVPGRGAVTYHLVLDASGARVAGGPAEDPTVVVETDHATAVALATGELNAQAALASGRWRLHGTTGRLAGRAAVLQAVGDVFAALRAGTTFPAPA
jgi:hypothetical protein